MNGGTHNDRPNVVYPAETRKKDKWVDIFCPRCGESLGFKDIPKIHAAWDRKCYDCGGSCHVVRESEYIFRIMYTKEKQ